MYIEEKGAERKVSLYLFPFSFPLLCTFLLSQDLHLSFILSPGVSHYCQQLSLLPFAASQLDSCEDVTNALAGGFRLPSEKTLTHVGAELVVTGLCHCLVAAIPWKHGIATQTHLRQLGW